MLKFCELYTFKNTNKMGMFGRTPKEGIFTLGSNKTNYFRHLYETNAIYSKTIR